MDKKQTQELEKLIERTYRNIAYQSALHKPTNNTAETNKTTQIKKFVTKETRPPQVNEYDWR